MLLTPINQGERTANGALKLASFIVALAISFPAEVFAQGLPVRNGPMLPVAIIWAGSGLLGLVLIYGLVRNRTRSRAEKQVTERATKSLYAEADRDEKKREESGDPI